MKQKLVYLLWVGCLMSGMLFASCIRDEIEYCPSLKITVTVKDKNYFNAEEVAAQGLYEVMDENLPFRSYVSSLYYIVHDEAGNVVAEQPNMPVEGDAKEAVIQLPVDLPYGKYRVTVWGNMKSERPLDEHATTAELEHTDAAQNDIYLANGEVVYAYGNENHALALERTKGRLIIVAENLPDYIDFSEKTIEDVYSVITSDFQYSGLVDLVSQTPWTEPNDIITHTLTCPSEGIETANLAVDFYDADVAGKTRAADYLGTLSPEDVRITMGRNEITVVKYIYVKPGEPEPGPDEPEEPEGPDEPEQPEEPDDPDSEPEPSPEPEGRFFIYILVNDNWEQIHQMEVD